MQKRGGNLQITSVGIHVDAYWEWFSSEAQVRFGHSYIACFKLCITMLALRLRTLLNDYQLSVVFEQNDMSSEVVKVFNLLKSLDKEIGPRLGICTPGQWKENVPLQAADLVAYESMRLMKDKRHGANLRWAFQQLFGISGFMGYYLDAEILKDMASLAERATCRPSGWLPISPQFDPDYVEGDTWEDLERRAKEKYRGTL